MKIKASSVFLTSGFYLHNRVVLYFLMLVALVHLLYLAVQQEFISATVFLLTAFLLSWFNKNLIIILFLSLTITALFRVCSNIETEGMTTQEKEATTPTTQEKETTTQKANDIKKNIHAKQIPESMVADDSEMDETSNQKKRDRPSKSKSG